ncbi:DUF5337 domain-containing protein [Oceaniovalibus sp. ACAM 378]|jgi:fucose permease|uniref:DUF5337 domain-containing protein n=1 Tax=Oceaniovalibus sp. ACAM 378 TaxID=2599923 RepID=UPI0011D3A2F0|nr:DUF5337 domain-containing protein [Oceaniovalibus sp. ACAM 378]TYB91256.1 hypothetical protein FQ320_01820 [Oceaniovalibus sp. ACAM 378]
MDDPTPSEDSLARQQRAAGFVIAGAMVGWMGVQFLGSQGMITERVMFLFDFAALAAMVWALVVVYGVWRKRRANPRK